MKKGLTEIVFILDESGSMAGLEKDTVGGYNSFIEKQREQEGEAFVSTVLFADDSKVIHDRIPLSRIEPLNGTQYRPGGSTALLDAIGGAIHHIGNVHKYARDEDRPEKTIFVIITDGEENASRHYDYRKIKNMIERQQNRFGWEFMFLGANIDAIGEASKIGICADRAVRYECDSIGTVLNFTTVSTAMCEIRGGKALKGDWKNDIENYRHGKKMRK